MINPILMPTGSTILMTHVNPGHLAVNLIHRLLICRVFLWGGGGGDGTGGKTDKTDRQLPL